MYQGKGKAYSVYTRTTEGKSIRFPANILQPFVTHQGVQGVFSIQFDRDNRFIAIHSLD
ncbi:MAG: DUF2835 family protein [Cellvibrionaceae bacterium]